MVDAPEEQSELWKFMLEFYALPGVAQACLRLQNTYKLDIPLFLSVLRAVGMGRAIDADRIRALDARCGMWRETVIKPLRSARTGMKAQSRMTDEMEGWELRERIKGIELHSEQLEILLLERLISELPTAESPSARDDMSQVARLLLEASGSIFPESLPTEANWIIDSLVASSDRPRR